MLIPLIVLGGLAAAVFGIVYAIVNKRPGVAVASVLVPLGLIGFFGLLCGLFWALYPVVRDSRPAHVNWTAGPSMPAMPAVSPLPAMPPMPPMPPVNVSGAVHVSWFKLAVVILVCVGLVKLFRKRASCNGEHRGGWGKTFAVAALLIVAASFVIQRASYVPNHVARSHVEATWRLKEQVRRDVENSQRKVVESQHRDEAAQEQAAHQMIESTSIQELWEKLNQPRIQLESAASGESPKPPGDVTRSSDDGDGEGRLSEPISEHTPEALARSFTRLERMVKQVSAVADQVSDAGTLIGKAMIALNETMDSRSALPPETNATALLENTLPVKVEGSDSEGSHPSTEMAHVTTEHDTTSAESSGGLDTRSEDSSRGIANNVRPAWVDLPPKRVGNTRRSVIVAGDFSTREECDREADRLLMLATADHLAELTGTSFVTTHADQTIMLPGGSKTIAKTDDRIRQLQRMNVGLDFVRREIAKDEYEETVQLSFGPMKRLYTLVEFTPSVDTDLLGRWDAIRRQERFAVVGAGAGSVLGLIGLAFGLLKVDTWTKGYYTKWLFLGVPAAIMGSILALITWMEVIF